MEYLDLYPATDPVPDENIEVETDFESPEDDRCFGEY